MKLSSMRPWKTSLPVVTMPTFFGRKGSIVTTGNEVFHGRIQDGFTPVILKKVAAFGAEIVGHELSDDDPARITRCIHRILEAGSELVICTGGMSVDPDDRTPAAIRASGARIVSYGAPVLPGAMFLLSYWGENNIPIIGVPGCAMYHHRTILDLVLPRLFADDEITKEDLDRLGEGGLCLNCESCSFPNCGFGK